MKQAIAYTLHNPNAYGQAPIWVYKTIVTPLDSKRIGRIYCEFIPLYYTPNSLITLRVDGIEVLKNFPLRWINPKDWTLKRNQFVPLEQIYNDKFSIDIDELAAGSEVEIEIYNDASIIVHIDYDDKPLLKFRKKHNIQTIAPVWQRNSLFVANNSDSWKNVMKVSYTLNFEHPIVGLFSEFRINNAAVNMCSLSGLIGKVWDIWSNRYSKIPTLINLAVDDINLNRFDHESILREILNGTLISLTDSKGYLLNDAEERVIDVTNVLSPEESFFKVESSDLNYNLTVQVPIFLTYNPANPAKQNALPFNTADLQICFISHEPR